MATGKSCTCGSCVANVMSPRMAQALVDKAHELQDAVLATMPAFGTRREVAALALPPLLPQPSALLAVHLGCLYHILLPFCQRRQAARQCTTRQCTFWTTARRSCG